MGNRVRVETRCTAHRKNGTACRNYAMRGGNVCRMHGGGAPQVRRRAQERIFAAADGAAARLIEFMNDGRVPWPVRLTAARDLLDRAGLTPKTTVAVEVPLWARGMDELVVDNIISQEPHPLPPTSPRTRSRGSEASPSDQTPCYDPARELSG
jgi:hypothetical protein